MAQPGGETFGDEHLENWEYLCSGGFGLVYKATHKDLGIKVVIKLLDGDDGSGKLHAALCREAEYMAAADHQYVPRVYGMYQGCPPSLGSTKRHGIVMELMAGGSLQSFLQTLSKPPPWPLAFRLAHQVAQAMDYLHSQRDLVHMDLKPANILLDAKLNAKIADFGLSTVSNSVLSTNRETQGGTLSFIPPEAFGDKYRRVRSYDVYSYGILLWTILTGESPYPGGNHSLVPFRIQKGDRPDLHKIDVQKAAGLKELVNLMKKCWDPKPKKRPLFGQCVEVTSRVFSTHEEGIYAAVRDMMPPPPVPPGSTNREDFLKHSSPLSWDPNTVCKKLILSENNRKATHTPQRQPYADHPQRFTFWPNVLSRESLSDPCYFEVEWSGKGVGIAVSYKDINREEMGRSRFGETDMSWVLGCLGSVGDKCYVFVHNSIRTVLSGPVPSTGRNRVGVFVNQTEGFLSFYSVDLADNNMSLVHTETTSFTRGPLHAGIRAYEATAEVCEIW